ncbi:rhamnan synthesis F family protein [Paracoccus cavernae]|uniref:Rhamnan synthesis F family protein n=2 Tax=Paracoccus cavernae TaxID=1571207 RepID=A0ABT8D8N3_9RHOB|nr:rhamnan synthesis F family protein [Paracoccus cavernae]
MLARYQAIFVASERLAVLLRNSGLSASYLPQATDTTHFHPLRRQRCTEEIPLVFVGAYAPRATRRNVFHAVQAGFEPQIWGPGWKGVVPARLWRGERLDHDELAETYASARIVLNSHMPFMSMLGFMSNRSYDALACGALVASDRVVGFNDVDFPELHQLFDREVQTRELKRMLDGPAVDITTRTALHERLARQHGFGVRAAVVLAQARALLASSQVAPSLWCHGRAEVNTAPPALSLIDRDETVNSSLLSAGREILAMLSCLKKDPATDTLPTPQHGIIHALSADLHEATELVRIIKAGARIEDHLTSIEVLARRSRRLVEALEDNTSPLRFRARKADHDRLLPRIIENEPLWDHSPAGFGRERGKVSLPLRPRKVVPELKRPIGVFLHLYYDGLAPVFAERLGNIPVPFQLYVSTDADEKAERIRESLPDAEIRVIPNRGRDIWPKLYGFADAKLRHDLVLHLHGKRSVHSDQLDEWLAHILDCLLGSPGEIRRILSFFQLIPRLGMVAPVTFKAVLGAAHWGSNRDIARELARRMALPGALPDNNSLRFPVGSMFWARTAALQPLLDLNLPQAAFPPEAGQVDGTLAHAIERMLGVTCQSLGYHILPVSGAQSNLHRKHQVVFHSTRELREALDKGDLDA